jgi:hypothetical protein
MRFVVVSARFFGMLHLHKSQPTWLKVVPAKKMPLQNVAGAIEGTRQPESLAFVVKRFTGISA